MAHYPMQYRITGSSFLVEILCNSDGALTLVLADVSYLPFLQSMPIRSSRGRDKQEMLQRRVHLNALQNKLITRDANCSDLFVLNPMNTRLASHH